MKKFALTLLVLLLCAGFASAVPSGMDAWWVWVQASDVDGQHWADEWGLGIGWESGYTNGYDNPDPYNDDEYIPVALGPTTVAAIDSNIPGTDLYSLNDFRIPAVDDVTTKIWNLRIYYVPGNGQDPEDSAPIDTIMITVAPSVDCDDFPYEFGPLTFQCDGQEWRFDADHPFTDEFSFNVTGAGVGSAVPMTVIAGAVPEPTSLMALASGLLGIAGVALRRRR